MGAEENPAAETKTVKRSHSAALAGSSLLSAIGTLVATVIIKHVFEGPELAEFLIFWSILFACTSIMTGVQPEVTRAVTSAHHTHVYKARIVPVILIFGIVAALLVLLTAWWWAPAQVPISPYSAVIAIACGVFFYIVQAFLSGASAGNHHWYFFAAIGSVESMGRLALMIAAAFVIPSLMGMEIATVAPMMLWVFLVIAVAAGRSAWSVRADVEAGQLAKNLGWALVSAIASAVLMLGFPAILNSSQKEISGTEVIALSILILAISITRSPIMIPLVVFQGVAIAAFVKQKHRPLQAFIKPAAAVVGVGVVGAGAAWLLGPWLFSLLYPAKPSEVDVYAQVVTGPVLASLVFAAALLALLTLSGNISLAVGLHRGYMLGWIVAAFITCLVVFIVPLPLVVRAISALMCGPIVGICVHLWAVSRLNASANVT